MPSILKILPAAGLMLVSAGLTGCGAAAPACSSHEVLTLSPAMATADHAAKPPGNQQQFRAVGTYATSQPGCAVPALAILEQPDWTSADPIHVQISSAKDATNGLATCLGPTDNPVLLTASTAATQPATVTLSCK